MVYQVSADNLRAYSNPCPGASEDATSGDQYGKLPSYALTFEAVEGTLSG